MHPSVNILYHNRQAKNPPPCCGSCLLVVPPVFWYSRHVYSAPNPDKRDASLWEMFAVANVGGFFQRDATTFKII